MPSFFYSRFSFSLVLLLITFGFIKNTLADEPTSRNHGFELGLRTGYGLPFGKTTGSGPTPTTTNGANTQSENGAAALGDSVKGQVPLGLDIGYRITPAWYAGVYLNYGFTSLAENFDEICSQNGISCAAHSARVGVNVHYHFLPAAKLDPWVGLGFGYELLGYKISGPDSDAGALLRGWELVNLQVGADYRVARGLRIGPVATFTLAQYSHFSVVAAAS